MKRRVLILGGQGYLGWSLGVSLALSTDADVVLADNHSKLEWARQVDGAGINTSASITDRLAALSSAAGRSVRFVSVNVAVYEELASVLTRIEPDVVVNCAHQPSAPYSETSHERAAFTLQNNIASHLNALWCIKTLNRPVKYIEVNSAGTLSDVDVECVPSQKVQLAFVHDGVNRQITDTWLPMQASDLYHLSKAQNFMVSEMFASRFGMTITSVRQSVMFGLCPVEGPLSPTLFPPLYYDPIFGTVANRFVLQHAAGMRATVYSDGAEFTGLISLKDAVDSLVRCCLSDGNAGRLEVLHNQTFVATIRDVAALAELDEESRFEIASCGASCKDHARRRLAPSEHGPRPCTIREIAADFVAFSRLAKSVRHNLNLECLGAVCSRRGY